MSASLRRFFAVQSAICNLQSAILHVRPNHRHSPPVYFTGIAARELLLLRRIISKLTKYPGYLMSGQDIQTSMTTEEAFRALVRTYGLMRRVMEPFFVQYGISGSQWGILRALHRAAGEGKVSLRATDLGNRLLIRPPSVSGGGGPAPAARAGGSGRLRQRPAGQEPAPDRPRAKSWSSRSRTSSRRRCSRSWANWTRRNRLSFTGCWAS